MKIVNSFFSVVLCSLSLTACGGTGGSASAASSQPTNPVASDGLGGTPGQPFAQRLTQTEYPKSLVNDPEAMKRILGEDKDQNGIRDDVDAFIATISNKEASSKAFQQYARGLQEKLLINNRQQAYSHQDKMVRAIKCVRKVFETQWGAVPQKLSEYDKFTENLSLITKKTFNSTERIIRSNEVSVLKHGVTASFDPSENVSQACD